MAELSEKLPPLSGTSTVRAAFAFITVGGSIKLALFPLHMWLPNIYTHAPNVVSAFLSSTATKVSYYVLIARDVYTLWCSVGNPGCTAETADWSDGLGGDFPWVIQRHQATEH